LPEEIPKRLPNLKLAQVFDALSYYCDHEAEIDAYIESNRNKNQSINPSIKPDTLQQRPYGLCAGEFFVPDDFDEPLSDEIISQFEGKWNRWFDEVDRLEPEPPTVEPDEYGEELINKYKQQGLDF